MSATVTEDEHNFKNLGVFRTKNDLIGMSWQTEDTLSHVDFRYPEDGNFTGVKLVYDYEVSGFTPLMNETQAPVMTIKTYSGEDYYIRLWNYVPTRPEDEWERGSGHHFPEGRSPGSNDTGAAGTIVIDFDELYAGWSAYSWQKVLFELGSWEPNPDWVKVPVNNIKEIMWSIAPNDFRKEGVSYLDESMKFAVKFKNWTVTGNSFLCSEPGAASVLPIRICDGYDDIYNMTPERVVGEYASLGYGGTVNMYIGASHYYDKKYDSTDRKLTLIADYPFNVAFEEWYTNYIQRLKGIGVQNLIHSISMENVNPPESWKQRAWNSQPATTGWTPTPYLLSFTNQDVKSFYEKYALNLARLSQEAGLRPMIQLGEPWWWFMEDGQDNLPCFYDEATKQMYFNEYGKQMHIFKSGNDPIEGHEDVLYFLRDKNGAFSHMLRDVVKFSYPNALFTVLFFPPSVMDKNRVPMKMSIANFPKEHWKSPNLDFFMLEDYDYLVDNHMDKHGEAITFIQNNLGYDESKIHYFSGFVLNQEKLEVWNRIDQAISDSFSQGFAETYIWAYAQVKRDGWRPQNVIYTNKPSGNYSEPITVTFSCHGAGSLQYTLDDGSPSSSQRMVYTGGIYVDKTAVITVVSIKNGVESKPIRFKYTMPVSRPTEDKINIDGDAGDWTDITAVSVGDRRIFDFSAVQSNDTLFVLVRGSQMDTSSNLYIDVNDGSTVGFSVLPWKNARADFMVSNDAIMKYTGSGQDWTWTEIGKAQIAKTPSVVEIAIPLEMIGLSEPRQINLGFGRKFEDFAPMTGNKMAAAYKTITMMPSPVFQVYLSPSSVTMTVNDTWYLKATVVPSNVGNAAVTWTSNNPEVATIDSSGVLCAKSEGTAVITVRAVMDSSKFAICTVTVNAWDTIIIVPGIMGSELFAGNGVPSFESGTKLWDPALGMNAAAKIKRLKCNSNGNPEYPSIYAADQNKGAKSFYLKLYNELNAAYPDKAVHYWPYDWRKSNADSAAALNTYINSLYCGKVVLVAHSMGGLVSSHYLAIGNEQRNKIHKLITLGTPFLGAPKLVDVFKNGNALDDLWPDLYLDITNAMPEVMYNMKSVYELMPTQKYFTLANQSFYTYMDKDGVSLSTHIATTYPETRAMLYEKLPNVNIDLINQAQSAHSALFESVDVHVTQDVDSYYIVGTNKSTPTQIRAIINNSNMEILTAQDTNDGDETVPKWSANIGGTTPYLKTYYANDRGHTGGLDDDGTIETEGLLVSDNVITMVKNIINDNPEDMPDGIVH